MATGFVKKDKQRDSWYYEATLGVDEKGKRIRKKKRFDTKKEAQQALADLLSAANKGEYVEPSKVLYRDYLNDWLESKKISVRESTWKSYSDWVRLHIIPALGDLEISKITPQRVEKFMLDLGKNNYAGSTMQKIHTIIKDSLNKAERWQMVSKNVVDLVDRPKASKEEMLVWDNEQSLSFLKHAKSDRLYIAFLLALTTGMRQGEILGLRWKDVDLENGIVYVKQTLSHDGQRISPLPKTAAGRRSITVPSEVISDLIKHKLMISSERRACGSGYKDNNLVVCTTLGTPQSPRNLNRTFQRLLKSVDVPKIRFHDLRHTHATLLLVQGVNPKVVSERLGHATIKITLDTYTHVLPSLLKDVAEEFGKNFFKSAF